MGFEKLRSVKDRPEELMPLVPQGFRARITLRSATDRKKKRTAAADSWSPESGDSVIIYFEPIPGIDPERQGKENRNVDYLVREFGLSHEEVMDLIKRRPNAHSLQPEPASSGVAKAAAPVGADPVRDLVLALHHAESRSDFKFIALKWFRDTALVEAGFPWASADAERQRVLKQAIDRNMILTGRVPNPRAPEFPVTSVRLNRMLPEVLAILQENQGSADDFEPAAIRGEALSATVLRDRR